MFLSSSMILSFVVELATAGSRIWDTSGCWKLLHQQNWRKPTDYWTGWVQHLEFLLITVLSPRTERATMWRHDQTKDFIDCAFRHLRRCILLENWHPGAHGTTTVGRLHCIFCSETGALCRYLEMPKNNVSELVSITNLLRQTSLEFGNCKIWSCLWMSHANSNQKRHMAHLEQLNLYPQCPYNQNCQCITSENGVCTYTTIICERFLQVSDSKCSFFLRNNSGFFMVFNCSQFRQNR